MKRFFGLVFLVASFAFGETIGYFGTDQELTIEQVKALDASAYKPYDAQNMGFGFTSQTYWIKINLQNDQPITQNYRLEFEYPTLDDVKVYGFPSASLPFSAQYGDTVPNSHPQISNTFTHYFILAPNEKIELYAEVKTEGSMILRVAVHESENYLSSKILGIIGLFLYYGVTIGLLIYNLFLYFGLREKVFLYYVMFHLTFMSTQLSINGVGNWLLWNPYPATNYFATPTFMLFNALFASLFAMSFLNIKSKTLVAFAGASVALMVLPFVVSNKMVFTAIIPFTNLASIVILVIAVLEFVRHRNIQAKFFLIGWSGLLLGVIILNLKNAGVLPVNFVTSYGSQFAAVFEMVFLSLALIHKYTQLQIQNHQNQRLLEEKERHAQTLLTMTQTDSLTTLFNRRYLFNRTEELRLLGQLEGLNVAIMIDIDHFKMFNDQYGHKAGDDVLVKFAHLVSDVLGENDIFCRYGGEEFVILRTNTSFDAIEPLLQKIQATLKEVCTVSMGVVSVKGAFELDKLLINADIAMYTAKSNGRNQYQFYSEA